MKITDEQYNRINSYLNDLLSPEEEVAFMKELNESDELQREFDFELILRESLNPTLTIEQPEHDTHDVVPTAGSVAKLTGFWPLYKKIISVAAVFILLASSLILYLTNKQNRPIAINKYPVERKLTLPKKDSGTIREPLRQDNNTGQIVIADNLSSAQAFKKYYSRYKGTEQDPVEVSRYFTAYYYDKNYNEVINATGSDYQTKGATDSLSAVYVQFYKSLSWIETEKPAKGAEALKNLLKQTDTSQNIYHFIQWYLAMAYLKNNDITAAKNVLQTITIHKNASPYKSKAGQLLKELS